jgi:iron complex transport system substrate-binding protein
MSDGADPVAARRTPVLPTIVSLNPCSDAVLAELADPAQILGLSHYSSDPRSSSMDVAAARRFRSIGDSGEEVLALQPDVVVASAFLAPATAQAIEARGLRLVRLPIARTIAESRAQVRLLAGLAGQPARGEALIARIDAALAEAAPPEGAQPMSALVWQSGGIVAGDETLAADVLRQTGFANAAAARGLRQADYLPLERMIADPPRVILTAGGEGEEDRLLSHPALAGLTGTRRADIDPALLWCGGPTIARLAQRLAQVRKTL